MTAASFLRPDPPEDFFKTARFNMVESQLRPNRVLGERLLNAMGHLPREAFVAQDQQSFAYSDEEIPVGFGRKMVSPMVFARLLQEVRVQPTDRVLDIGAATGYSCAVLNELAGEVIALESEAALMRVLQQNKSRFLLENVRPVQGNLNEGHPPAAPYQVIMIEGGVQWLPENLFMQLAEGGRLACVTLSPSRGLPDLLGRARIYEKKAGRIKMRDLFDATAPLLPAFAARPHFEF